MLDAKMNPVSMHIHCASAIWFWGSLIQFWCFVKCNAQTIHDSEISLCCSLLFQCLFNLLSLLRQIPLLALAILVQHNQVTSVSGVFLCFFWQVFKIHQKPNCVLSITQENHLIKREREKTTEVSPNLSWSYPTKTN